jgi:hypothetical protein
MRKLLPLGALLALAVAACATDTVTAPDEQPSFACRGNSGNCGGGGGGGGSNNNNPNNPPATTP